MVAVLAVSALEVIVVGVVMVLTAVIMMVVVFSPGLAALTGQSCNQDVVILSFRLYLCVFILEERRGGGQKKTDWEIKREKERNRKIDRLTVRQREGRQADKKERKKETEIVTDRWRQ